MFNQQVVVVDVDVVRRREVGVGLAVFGHVILRHCEIPKVDTY